MKKKKKKMFYTFGYILFALESIQKFENVFILFIFSFKTSFAYVGVHKNTNDV